MELLEVLKEKNRNFSIAELAEAMELPPSTVHRILQTFCEKKYVIRDDRSHTYRLGPALIPLGKAAARGIRLQDAAHSILTQLAKQTKEDAYLEQYSKMFADDSMSHHMDTSDVDSLDQAFAEGMIMHHQMAVDMARDILEYTDYEEIRTMAQNIIDVQEKEIAQMEKILNDQQESQPE